MTDRAQPGAIKSLARNDELAQIHGQANDSWVVPGGDPTPAAQRRTDIDEAALDAFALSLSASSLMVTVEPGEAFVSGWCVRDVPTDIDLPGEQTTDIVVGWDPDSVFDPEVDADRDAADQTIVSTAAAADPLHPTTVVWRVETDATGVVNAERIAPMENPAGGGAGISLAFDYIGV